MGATITTAPQFAPHIPPMSQSVISLSFSSLVRYLRIMTPAVKIYPITTPARMRVALEEPFIREIPYMRRIESHPSKNAHRMMTPFWNSGGINGIIDPPKTMAIAAPNDAAEESPRVKGLTSGFRRSACMTHPAMARLIPVRIARRTRGNLKSITTIFSDGVLSRSPGFVTDW